MTGRIWGYMKGRKKNRFLLSFSWWMLLLLVRYPFAFSQTQGEQRFPVLFYNVENLFDCYDDPLTNDGEFLPDAKRHWTFKRYNEKVNKIAKVILASNGWELPALVGLCEVENGAVLKRLVWETGLSESGYRFIHHESPDKRGIDVALLYRKNEFRVLHDSAVCVSEPENDFFTRDILYVKGVFFGSDTLNVFACHLPSKYGGAAASEPKRQKVADKLRELCDSLLNDDPNCRILIMGDMNESPDEKAMRLLAGAGLTAEEGMLVDLASDLKAEKVKGTVKYRGNWEVFDQVIVSRSLTEEPFRVEGMSVVELPFLLERDETYSGVKPFRTFLGPVYHGGFSDHLPVKAVLIKNAK